MAVSRAVISFNTGAVAEMWAREWARRLEQEHEKAQALGTHIMSTDPDRVWAEAAKHVYDRKHGRLLHFGFLIRAFVVLPRNWRQIARKWLVEQESA